MRNRKSSSLAVCLILASASILGRASAWTCDSPRNVTLTESMLDDLTERIQIKIDSQISTDPDGRQYKTLVPGFVRLPFHSCAAKWCSSRIDLSNPGNGGLQHVVAAADELHAAIQLEPQYTGFSKADMYALCGVVALQVATRFKTRVPFRYGRPDFCPRDDPKVLDQTLPSTRMDTEATYAFMKKVFNFTPKETAIIMGAHSLGVVRNSLKPPVPAFRWASKPADKLTNNFYQALLDPRWHQVDRLVAGRQAPSKQWVIDDLPTKLMFNTDLGLVRRITSANASGTSVCTTYLSCPLAPTSGTILKYAVFEDSFLADFSRVFVKMIENGLSDKLYDVVAEEQR